MLITRVLMVSLTIHSQCFIPGVSFPCSTQAKRKKNTKQSFVLTFHWMYEWYCTNCINYSVKRRPLTWAILIIGTMIIPSFPPSWLYLNSNWQSLIPHDCVMDGSHMYNTFLTQKNMSECTWKRVREREYDL